MKLSHWIQTYVLTLLGITVCLLENLKTNQGGQPLRKVAFSVYGIT